MGGGAGLHQGEETVDGLPLVQGGGGDNIRREVKRDMLLFSLACSDGMISEFRHRVAGQVLLLVQKVEYITPCMLEVMGVKTTDWDRELK